MPGPSHAPTQPRSVVTRLMLKWRRASRRFPPELPTCDLAPPLCCRRTTYRQDLAPAPTLSPSGNRTTASLRLQSGLVLEHIQTLSSLNHNFHHLLVPHRKVNHLARRRNPYPPQAQRTPRAKRCGPVLLAHPQTRTDAHANRLSDSTEWRAHLVHSIMWPGHPVQPE